MALAYYSTVLPTTADVVWDRIRDFGSYEWAGTGYHAILEDRRTGDSVGSVRAVQTAGALLRQRLLAHSDRERFYSYCFVGGSPYPVRDYEATLRVTPVVDGDQAFVEWSARFDTDGADADHWTTFFRSSFAGWLDSLRSALTP